MLTVMVRVVDGNPCLFGQILLVHPRLASSPLACGHQVAFEPYRSSKHIAIIFILMTHYLLCKCLLDIKVCDSLQCV